MAKISIVDEELDRRSQQRFLEVEDDMLRRDFNESSEPLTGR